MFEYIYEPVFCDVNTYFYQINFHQYLAWNMYNCFINNDISAEELFKNFYEFIKHSEQKNLIEYIHQIPKTTNSFINYISAFCNQHKAEIASDIEFEKGDNQYLLDLTLTSLYGLLSSFSNGTSEQMDVHCDKSKQIEYNKEFWKPFVNNKQVIWQTTFNTSQITFNITSLPKTEDSKEVIQLQISDLLVSSLMYAHLHPKEAFSKTVLELSQSSFCSQFSIIPVELEYTFDKHEIIIFSEIIKLLSSKISKPSKIEKLKYLSSALKSYQIQREHFLLNS